MTGHIQLFCILLNRRLLAVGGGQPLTDGKSLIRGITHRTADADRVIVAKVAADFAYYHGHRIGRKFYIVACVKVIERLNQANTDYLKQVIGVFAAVAESVHNAENKP